MVTPILSRSIWKYFFRHPWVILLSILGVAIGVAVVVSVDIATTSAKRAFEVSVENLTGNATHQVIGSPLGMEEDIFVRLKLEFPDLESSPVVEGYVEVRGETLQMLGLDFFSNTYLTEHLSCTGSQALLSLLLEPDTTFITGDTAERLGVLPGDTIGISVGGEKKEVKIAGLTGSKEDSTLDGIIIADISTAQEVLNKTGFIDRINLVIAEEDESTIPQLKEWLPEGTTVISTAARNESTLKITDAFSVNLTAMSLLALLVGMFLIYNTMTFSVLQRRGLIGSLRVIGATRREIFSEVLIEAGVIGFIGTSLGVFLGILLGQEMVKLVLRTVNDLYFVLTVSTFYISAGMVIKGMLLGIAVSVAASFVPAIEAASSPPQTVRLRSVMESLARRLLPHISITGILMMAVSIAILFLSGKSILAGFVSLFMLVIGFALCVPVIVEFISRSIGRLTSKGANVLGKMAAAGIAGSLSRTGTAIAAMTVAISVVVGMGTMINSFRSTVDLWLSQALSSDVYVTTTSDISSRSDNPLPEELVLKVLAIDGVEAIKKMKTVYLEASAGVVEVHAIEPVAQSRNEYRLKEGDYIQAWESFEKGESIFLAEPYAYKNNLKVGDSVSFLTAEGLQQFPVSGIFFDYSTDQGIILMPYSLYSYYWQDSTISSMGLYLADKSDKEDIMNYLESEVAGIPGVVVTDNFNLRQSGLNVFDRTFLITRVLEFLVIIVAFIGILSALMAYQLEKVREIGILRATGFTPRQIWGMISLQTGFMGAISGVLAIPLGLIVSVILTTIINIRSFGWSMQMDISPATILEAMAIAVGAALLASIYPSWRMSRISPAEALREE